MRYLSRMSRKNTQSLARSFIVTKILRVYLKVRRSAKPASNRIATDEILFEDLDLRRWRYIRRDKMSRESILFPTGGNSRIFLLSGKRVTRCTVYRSVNRASCELIDHRERWYLIATPAKFSKSATGLPRRGTEREEKREDRRVEEIVVVIIDPSRQFGTVKGTVIRRIAANDNI